MTTRTKIGHARLFLRTDAAQEVHDIPHVGILQAALIALRLEIWARTVAQYPKDLAVGENAKPGGIDRILRHLSFGAAAGVLRVGRRKPCEDNTEAHDRRTGNPSHVSEILTQASDAPQGDLGYTPQHVPAFPSRVTLLFALLLTSVSESARTDAASREHLASRCDAA